MKILITGASGFVGRALCAHLRDRHELVVVSRDPERARQALALERSLALPATPAQWAAALEGCDAVVNLAGESIAAGRWTEARKRAIRDSRIEITRGIVGGITAAARPPRVLVSASAVGYYGPRGGEPIDESAPAGDDFLAQVCVDWEREAQAAESQGVRVARLRIGIVLGEGGGALERMVTPFKLFAGGPIGSGEQWMSWIHRDDLVRLIELALGDARVGGAVNGTAPDPRTMRDFARTLGQVLSRPSWAPVPAFVLRLALGEMADMLLTGQRVLPGAATRLGFSFEYPTLDRALRQALGLG